MILKINDNGDTAFINGDQIQSGSVRKQGKSYLVHIRVGDREYRLGDTQDKEIAELSLDFLMTGLQLDSRKAVTIKWESHIRQAEVATGRKANEPHE